MRVGSVRPGILGNSKVVSLNISVALLTSRSLFEEAELVATPLRLLALFCDLSLAMKSTLPLLCTFGEGDVSANLVDIQAFFELYRGV